MKEETQEIIDNDIEIEKEYLYEIGEVVEFKSEEELENLGHEINRYISFIPDMKILCGQKFTIIEINNNSCKYGIYEIKPVEGKFSRGFDNYFYQGNWFNKLEPIKENETDEIEKLKIVLKEEPNATDIEEMISKVNIPTFKQIIKARLNSDGDNPDNLTDEITHNLLVKWAKAKFRFYKLFGNNLILKDEIEVEKDEKFYRNKIESIKNEFPLYTPILNSLAYNDIVRNIYYSSESFYTNHKNVKRGMKLTKLIALYKNNDLNMAFSTIYQDKPIKNLYISIDPCDFLTVSINKSWRSCHNFINGEWRNAGYSLMQDSTSMVAYSSESEVNYGFDGIKFTWNNKNWRQMVYLSETNSRIIFSLQYPYGSEVLITNVRMKLEKLLADYLKVPNQWVISQCAKNTDVSYHAMYDDTDRNGVKSVINKFDVEPYCEIQTGNPDIRHLGHEDTRITKGESRLW